MNMPSRRITMDAREYAEHRGCSVRTVQRAIRAGKLSLTPAGRIDAATADVRWAPVDPTAPRLAAHRDELDAEAARGKGDVEELKRRLLAATASEREWKARLRQIEHELKAADSLPRSAVLEDARELGAKLRNRLLAFGSRLGIVLTCPCRDPGEVQRVVDREVAEFLNELQASRVMAETTDG